MDKVLTINDWWDGPVTGLATYNSVICIYVRIFDILIDEYGDEYFLTPIDDAEVEMLMNEWCVACSKNDLDSFYKKYLNNHSIDQVLKKAAKRISIEKELNLLAA